MVSERVLAFVRWMDSHLVWEHGEVSEEANCRDCGLNHGAPFVSVAFKLYVFEVQGFVASAGCFPSDSRFDKGTWGKALVTQRASHGNSPSFCDKDLICIAELALQVRYA